MSDAVSRDAVMQLLQEWTYCCDVEDAVRALPAVQPGHVNETPKIEHDATDMLKLSVQGEAREDGIRLAAALVKERLGNSHLSNKILALIEKPKGS